LDWLDMVWDKGKRRSFLNTAMNLGVP